MRDQRKMNACPKTAMPLESYAALEQSIDAFEAGHLQGVLLLGPPGVGKSQVVRQKLGETAGWISGNATPFGVYMRTYEYRNRPLVLDDVDELCGTAVGVRLLKALCQTDPIRTVAWETAAQALDRHAVPRQFQTSSQVILIANEWESTSLNVQAVEDRLHVFLFEPTAVEIHRRASTWFDEPEVFEFIGGHLSLFTNLSLRTYVRGAQLKQAGFDWRDLLLRQVLSGPAATVARLKADTSFPSEEARARAFVAAGHGCRATYFNHARRLPKTSAVDNIPLRKPPSPPSLVPRLRLRPAP